MPTDLCPQARKWVGGRCVRGGCAPSMTSSPTGREVAASYLLQIESGCTDHACHAVPKNRTLPPALGEHTVMLKFIFAGVQKHEYPTPKFLHSMGMCVLVPQAVAQAGFACVWFLGVHCH